MRFALSGKAASGSVGKKLILRQQAGAEPERLLPMSRRVGFVDGSCLCRKTSVFFITGIGLSSHSAL